MSSSQDESDNSITDDDSGSSQRHDGYTWAEDYEDLDPSDSASVSADYQYAGHQQRGPTRTASRKHTRSQRQQSLPYRTIPAPQQAMSADPSEEYDRWGARTSYNPYYGQHAQSHVGGYGQQQQYSGGRGQMVPFPSYGHAGHAAHAPPNPFSPMPNGGGAAYFNDPRSSYDMVPYQNNFFGGAPQYGMSMIPPYMYGNAPPPPPTEAPAPSHTPAPPAEKKPDPEVERMKQQLELLQAEKKAKEDEIKNKQLQEQMRQTAELEFERRMERARKEADEQKKELEKAKADAERAARERIENERKAEAEKKAQHEQALARIEAEARAKFENERREEENKKKRDAEIAAAAEAALKAKMEAAEAAARAKAAADFKAEIEAKEAAEKKVKEEIEWRKKLEEEAKLKAEIEARAKLEEERKKAEEAKIAEEEKKKADKAMREKIVEETKAKLEEDAKKNEKLPIKFKDAVGRKFSFPFHLCQTWAGMEELIKQAFVQVEAIGPHVQEGHYDLIGPNGEIILPSIWEKVVEPDWSVTMHMWPMDKTPPLRNGIPMNGMHMHGIPPGAIPVGGRHHVHGMPQGRGGMQGMPIPMRPGMMPQGAAGMPQRPGVWPPGVIPVGGMRPGAGVRMPANVVNGDNIRHEKKKGSSSKTVGTGFLNFIGGKPAKPSKKRK
ncbi:hypothetical protein SBRCBS47491_001140 [Sporothrix bragantina]|uniref:Ubiquitin-like domain-containing protein n=1 Tax=Sporothrix bragantina TaxID=671064 RepID=A0ABP0AW32_9PEZI